MKRIAWLTDIHLELLAKKDRICFAEKILSEEPDAVLIGGDIAQADNIVPLLKEFDAQLCRPIYFVLGNHDYYGGSIAQVRSRIVALSRSSRNLTWLPDAGVVELAPQTGLLGHDGWADARFGDYNICPVLLNDYFLIEELANLDDDRRQHKLFELGDEAAAYFRDVLPRALREYPQVVLLTHVPPFREAAWYRNKMSDDEHAPHFSSMAAGLALVETMLHYPDAHLTVLCGHTHGGGRLEVQENLLVVTGSARYTEPEVQFVLTCE